MRPNVSPAPHIPDSERLQNVFRNEGEQPVSSSVYDLSSAFHSGLDLMWYPSLAVASPRSVGPAHIFEFSRNECRCGQTMALMIHNLSTIFRFANSSHTTKTDCNEIKLRPQKGPVSFLTTGEGVEPGQIGASVCDHTTKQLSRGTDLVYVTKDRSVVADTEETVPRAATSVYYIHYTGALLKSQIGEPETRERGHKQSCS